MKLIFFIVLFLISSTAYNCKARDIAKELSELLNGIKMVLDHRTFRMLNEKSQYKILKAMLTLLESFTKRSNLFIERQMFDVNRKFDFE